MDNRYARWLLPKIYSRRHVRYEQNVVVSGKSISFNLLEIGIYYVWHQLTGSRGLVHRAPLGFWVTIDKIRCAAQKGWSMIVEVSGRCPLLRTLIWVKGIRWDMGLYVVGSHLKAHQRKNHIA